MDAKLPMDIFENVIQLAIEECKAIVRCISRCKKCRPSFLLATFTILPCHHFFPFACYIHHLALPPFLFRYHYIEEDTCFKLRHAFLFETMADPDSTNQTPCRTFIP